MRRVGRGATLGVVVVMAIALVTGSTAVAAPVFSEPVVVGAPGDWITGAQGDLYSTAGGHLGRFSGGTGSTTWTSLRFGALGGLLLTGADPTSPTWLADHGDGTMNARVVPLPVLADEPRPPVRDIAPTYAGIAMVRALERRDSAGVVTAREIETVTQTAAPGTVPDRLPLTTIPAGLGPVSRLQGATALDPRIVAATWLVSPPGGAPQLWLARRDGNGNWTRVGPVATDAEIADLRGTELRVDNRGGGALLIDSGAPGRRSLRLVTWTPKRATDDPVEPLDERAPVRLAVGPKGEISLLQRTRGALLVREGTTGKGLRGSYRQEVEHLEDADVAVGGNAGRFVAWRDSEHGVRVLSRERGRRYEEVAIVDCRGGSVPGQRLRLEPFATKLTVTYRVPRANGTRAVWSRLEDAAPDERRCLRDGTMEHSAFNGTFSPRSFVKLVSRRVRVGRDGRIELRFAAVGSRPITVRSTAAFDRGPRLRSREVRFQPTDGASTAAVQFSRRATRRLKGRGRTGRLTLVIGRPDGGGGTLTSTVTLPIVR